MPCSIATTDDQRGGWLSLLQRQRRETNPYIVALAEIGEINATSEWTPFDLQFKYTGVVDPDLLRANGYSIAIVCTSSYEGATFQGAVGSTLYVDEFELICED